MSLGKKVLTSSSLLIGIKFFQRLVGLISILILARLLTPEDFAIVALVSIIVHFFDILSNAGSEQYIIQKDNVSKHDLNTAWTIDLTMKLLLWIFLILSSPYVAAFFEQPELKVALYASSSILIINALKNPGLFLKKQNFEYGRIFWLSVIQRLVTFLVVIAIAYIEHSYWALIIGDIISSLIYSAGSYIIDKHKSKLCFSNWKKQWNFSTWLLFKGIIGYTRSQIDTLIVSKFFPANQLGQYYMARDIAMIPSHNILAPAIEPLLAVLSQARRNKIDFEYKIRFSLFIVSLISVPISMFMWFFPEPIIAVLLGRQWADSSNLLSALSLLLLYYSFVLVLEQGLLALQKVRALFWYDLLSLTFITNGLFLFKSDSLYALAYCRGILGLITMIVLFYYFSQLIKIKLIPIFSLLLSIFSISLVAIFFTSQLQIIYNNHLITLAQNILVFTTSFSVLIVLFFFKLNVDEINQIKKLIKCRFKLI